MDKEKDEMDESAYRPICLLLVLGKVLEKLLKLRLVHDLEKSGFLHGAQFGFRENVSTESAVLAAVVFVKTQVQAAKYRYWFH